AHHDLQGGEDVADRDAQGLGLGAVEVDDELRVVGREGGEDAAERGRLVALGHDLARRLRQIVELALPRLVPELELEAGEVADALDRRRREGEDHGAGDAHERAAEAIDDAGGGVILAAALAPWLEVDEEDALVGPAAAEGEAADREDGLDLGLL